MHSNRPSILVFGAVGIDFLSVVQEYPQPDSKIRAERSELCGGGNAGNTSVTLCNLAVNCCLISKVGNDSYGNIILNELLESGVDVSYCVNGVDMISAFTYVIVCPKQSTRTCIHTPLREEITNREIDSILSRLCIADHSLVHFDSRHTSAAVRLAHHMAPYLEKSLMCTIDLEKPRTHIDKLLPFVDIIFTNRRCADMFFPEADGICSDYRASLFLCSQCNAYRCKAVVCTMGERGSLLIRRRGDAEVNIMKSSLMPERNTWLSAFDGVLYSSTQVIGKEFLPPIRVFHELVEISSPQSNDKVALDIIRCSAWPMENVVDTTGAGDAFIGGFLSALVHDRSWEDCLAMGTLVASEKLTEVGARRGIPTLNKVAEILEACKVEMNRICVDDNK